MSKTAARMKARPTPTAAILLLLILALLGTLAQPSDGLTYKTGYSSIMKLGKDVYNALKPAYRELISAQPISIETDPAPFVRLLYYDDEPKPVRGVWISAGFIDLVNNVAHARAIDTREKNYFKRYIDLLAQETGHKSLLPLPNDNNRRYWTDDMLNEQQSNFNSIVGMVVGIKLAHHYLGHYEKYKSRLADSKGLSVPITNLVTEKEWEDAFRSGVLNALNAGCMIEGVIPFFEAFDKMKVRPAWAAYFLPDNVKFSKMRKEMEKIQKRFLDGEN
jgi:hypothetical protein